MGDIDWDARAAEILALTQQDRDLGDDDHLRLTAVARLPYPTKRWSYMWTEVRHECDMSLHCDEVGGGPAYVVHTHTPPTTVRQGNLRLRDRETARAAGEAAMKWIAEAFAGPWISTTRELLKDFDQSETIDMEPAWAFGGMELRVGALFEGSPSALHHVQLVRSDAYDDWLDEVRFRPLSIYRSLVEWRRTFPGQEVSMEHHASLCRAVTQAWGPMMELTLSGEIVLRRDFRIKTRSELAGDPPVEKTTRVVRWGRYVLDHNAIVLQSEFLGAQVRIGPERRSRQCCLDADTYVTATEAGVVSEPRPIPPGVRPATYGSTGLHEHIDGLGEEEQARLNEAGILTLGQLRDADPAVVAEATGFSVELVSRWIEAAGWALTGDY